MLVLTRRPGQGIVFNESFELKVTRVWEDFVHLKVLPDKSRRTLREGESADFPGGVSVSVVETRGQMVKVGISAPRSVNIRRSELRAQTA